MLKNWTGTICNVEIPNFDPKNSDTFKVIKTPVDNDTPAEVIYERQSTVSEATNKFFLQKFGIEANIPQMELNNGSNCG